MKSVLPSTENSATDYMRLLRAPPGERGQRTLVGALAFWLLPVAVMVAAFVPLAVAVTVLATLAVVAAVAAVAVRDRRETIAARSTATESTPVRATVRAN